MRCGCLTVVRRPGADWPAAQANSRSVWPRRGNIPAPRRRLQRPGRSPDNPAS